MADPQLTVPEFAAKIRSKYGAYQDKSDQELVDAFLKKFPVYQSRLAQPTPQAAPQPVSTTGQTSSLGDRPVLKPSPVDQLSMGKLDLTAPPEPKPAEPETPFLQPGPKDPKRPDVIKAAPLPYIYRGPLGAAKGFAKELGEFAAAQVPGAPEAATAYSEAPATTPSIESGIPGLRLNPSKLQAALGSFVETAPKLVTEMAPAMVGGTAEGLGRVAGSLIPERLGGQLALRTNPETGAPYVTSPLIERPFGTLMEAAAAPLAAIGMGKATPKRIGGIQGKKAAAIRAKAGETGGLHPQGAAGPSAMPLRSRGFAEYLRREAEAAKPIPIEPEPIRPGVPRPQAWSEAYTTNGVNVPSRLEPVEPRLMRPEERPVQSVRQDDMQVVQGPVATPPAIETPSGWGATAARLPMWGQHTNTTGFERPLTIGDFLRAERVPKLGERAEPFPGNPATPVDTPVTPKAGEPIVTPPPPEPPAAPRTVSSTADYQAVVDELSKKRKRTPQEELDFKRAQAELDRRRVAARTKGVGVAAVAAPVAAAAIPGDSDEAKLARAALMATGVAGLGMAVAPRFYSRALEAAKALPTRVKTESVINLLKRSKRGVSAEELADAGLAAWLKGKGPVVTREEVVGHLQEKGWREPEVRRYTHTQETFGLTPDQDAEYQELAAARGAGVIAEADEARYQELRALRNAHVAANPDWDPATDGLDRPQDPRYANYRLNGPSERYEERVYREPGSERVADESVALDQLIDNNVGSNPAPTYTSPHYEGEPNYLFHSRLDERPTFDSAQGGEGVRTLHLDEVQGDRYQDAVRAHQATVRDVAADLGIDVPTKAELIHYSQLESQVRNHPDLTPAQQVRLNREGWRSQAGDRAAELDHLNALTDELNTARRELHDADRRVIASEELGALSDSEAAYNAHPLAQAYEAAWRRWRAAQHRLQEAEAQFHANPGIPPAPFKNTWDLLAVKDAVRTALERGINRITWTTGIQQSNRYTNAVRGAVDRLEVRRTTGSTSEHAQGTVYGFKNGKATSIRFPLSEADAYVGPKIASQLREKGVVEGDAIQVGGKGFTQSYDVDLVNKINKWLKSVGGGQVRKVFAEVGRRTDSALGPSWTEGYREPLWSFDITPKMSETLQREGISLGSAFGALGDTAKRHPGLTGATIGGALGANADEEVPLRGALIGALLGGMGGEMAGSFRDVFGKGELPDPVLPAWEKARARELQALAESDLGGLVEQARRTGQPITEELINKDYQQFNQRLQKQKTVVEGTLTDAIERGMASSLRLLRERDPQAYQTEMRRLRLTDPALAARLEPATDVAQALAESDATLARMATSPQSMAKGPSAREVLNTPRRSELPSVRLEAERAAQADPTGVKAGGGPKLVEDAIKRFTQDTEGSVNPKTALSLGGAALGAYGGAQMGDTPEERFVNALVTSAAGAMGGAFLGRGVNALLTPPDSAPGAYTRLSPEVQRRLTYSRDLPSFPAFIKERLTTGARFLADHLVKPALVSEWQLIKNGMHHAAELIGEYKSKRLDVGRDAFRTILRITAGLDAKGYRDFWAMIRLRADLENLNRLGRVEAIREGERPLTRQEIETSLRTLDAYASPAVHDALQRHQDLVRSIGEDLVARGKMSQTTLDAHKDYFPEYVIKYLAGKTDDSPYKPLGARWPLRGTRQGYLKERKGGERLTIRNYDKAMLRYMTETRSNVLKENLVDQLAQEYDLVTLGQIAHAAQSPPGYTPWTYSSRGATKTYSFPDPLVKRLRDYVEQPSQGLRLLNDITAKTKSYILRSVWGSFNIGNFFGDVYRYWAFDSSWNPAKKAVFLFDAARAKSLQMRQVDMTNRSPMERALLAVADLGEEFNLGTGAATGEIGNRVPSNPMWRSIIQDPEATAAQRLAYAVGNAPKAMGYYMDLMREYLEGVPRLAKFMEELSRGNAPKQAAKITRKIMIDYTDITPFEEKVLRGWLVPFWCVPEESLALTKAGWKTCDQLQVGELLLTYNPHSDQLEWQPCEEVAIFDHDQALSTLNYSRASLRFTPNHRWVTRNSAGRTTIKPANELTTDDDILTGAEFKGTESTISTEDARILGWLLTDGYWRWRGNYLEAVIYQHPKKFLEEVKQIAGGTPRAPHPDTGCVCVPVLKERLATLKQFLVKPKAEMDFAPLILGLSREALDAFWEAAYKGDGTTTMPTATQFIAAQIPSVREALLLAAYLRGKRPTLTPRGLYVGVRRSKSVAEGRRGSTHYTGRVWCPRTANSTWVMRQGNFVTITGNTFYKKNLESFIPGIATDAEGSRLGGAKLAAHAIGKSLALSSVMTLYNETFFPDAEHNLSQWERNQFHFFVPGSKQPHQISPGLLLIHFTGPANIAAKQLGVGGAVQRGVEYVRNRNKGYQGGVADFLAESHKQGWQSSVGLGNPFLLTGLNLAYGKDIRTGKAIAPPNASTGEKTLAVAKTLLNAIPQYSMWDRGARSGSGDTYSPETLVSIARRYMVGDYAKHVDPNKDFSARVYESMGQAFGKQAEETAQAKRTAADPIYQSIKDADPYQVEQDFLTIWPTLKGQRGRAVKAIYLEALSQAATYRKDFVPVLKRFQVASQSVGKKRLPYIQEQFKTLSPPEEPEK